MKIFIVLTLFGVIMVGFPNSSISTLIANTNCSSDTPPRSILVINSFDAMSIKARKNKRELILVLSDSLKNYLERTIKQRTGVETKVIADILPKKQNLDSMVFTLMKQYNAINAVLIWSLDVFFRETGTRETTDYDGKTKTIIFYDLCSKNEYTLYNTETILKQSTIERCSSFTEREVSGRFFIAAGPDIVGKKKYTFGAVEKNADNYAIEISSLIKN